MTAPTVRLDKLAADMRRTAARHLADVDVKLANALDFKARAESEAAAARILTSLAAGYAATATALESGAITIGDAGILTELRDGLADAQEAINPRLPFAQQRTQLAAADLAATQTWTLPTFGVPRPEAPTFEPGEVVNVADPEHQHWGVRGTVTVVRNDGLITITITDRGDMLTLPASSLMHHTAFVAQMDAAEQQAAKDAEAADDVYTAEERADDDAWAEAASDYAASLKPGAEADL